MFRLDPDSLLRLITIRCPAQQSFRFNLESKHTVISMWRHFPVKRSWSVWWKQSAARRVLALRHGFKEARDVMSRCSVDSVNEIKNISAWWNFKIRKMNKTTPNSTVHKARSDVTHGTTQNKICIRQIWKIRRRLLNQPAEKHKRLPFLRWLNWAITLCPVSNNKSEVQR